MGTPSYRLLSAYYDSVRQRDYLELLNQQPRVRSVLIGRLRFDTLLSQTLVITDAMLLDGAYFLDLGPDEILPALQRKRGQAPIEIRARAERLDSSILGFVKDGDTRKGFSFSTIQDREQREAAAAELKNPGGPSIRSWKDIPEVLRASGVRAADVERLRQGWETWVSPETHKRLRIVKWEGKMDLERCLGTESEIEARLHTATGKEKLREVWSFRNNRSKVDVLLESAKKTATTFQEHADYLAIATLYHQAYTKAQASQHQADVYEEVDSISWRRDHSFQEYEGFTFSSRVNGLDLDERLLLRLGELPDGKYQELFRLHENDFLAWWSSGDIDAFRSGIEPFLEEILGPSGGAASQSVHRNALEAVAPSLVGGGVGALIGFFFSGPTGAKIGWDAGKVSGPGLRVYAEFYQLRQERRRLAELTERVVGIAEARQRCE